MVRSLVIPVRALVAVGALAVVVASSGVPASRAAGLSQLQRVKGTVGHQTTDADFRPVFGRYDLATTENAVTRAASAAVVALPDSSLISLGENTTVNVGELQTAADGSTGPTITLGGGSLRFDVRRPAGGRANYHFTTTTSQLAVRGTVGLLSFINNVTTVACLACEADSVVLTVGSQTFTLVTGQVLVVSAAGVVTTSALTSTIVSSFSSASVPTSSAATSAAAGVPAAGGAAISGTTAAVAAGVFAGTAIGVTAATSQSTSAPQPQPTPTVAPSPSPSPSPKPTATPTPTPTATPTPASQSGTVNLQTKNRAPAGVPAAAPPPPAPPLAAPPGGPRIPSGRIER